MSQELANVEPKGLMASAVQPAQIMAVINHVHEILKGAMREGKPDSSGSWNGDGDYAIIPGTPKKSLLKPGAEKLLLSFGLSAVVRTPQIVDLGSGHREVIIETEVISMATGRVHAVGIGSCSTMESKYRYRNVSDYTVLDEPIPKDAKEQKQSYRRKGFGMKKIEGAWCWVKYGDERREENPDIADTYNTVLKMAKKRSLVDGAIQATASSGMFTQDLDEEEPEEGAEAPQPIPPPRPQAPQAPATAPAAPKDLIPTVRTDPQGMPLCPVCEGPMYDNRADRKKAEEEIAAKTRTKAAPPAWKCKAYKTTGCKGTLWQSTFNTMEEEPPVDDREPGQEG